MYGSLPSPSLFSNTLCAKTGVTQQSTLLQIIVGAKISPCDIFHSADTVDQATAVWARWLARWSFMHFYYFVFPMEILEDLKGCV